MKTTEKKRNKRLISILLFFSLITVPVSAVIVHATHGTATSHIWLHIHAVFGIVFVVAGIYHVAYNWRTLKHYLIGKKR
jgi:hypothetical protein